MDKPFLRMTSYNDVTVFIYVLLVRVLSYLVYISFFF